MDTLKIIFWVCVVEAVMGHLPWSAPLAVFGMAMLYDLLAGKKKKKDDDDIQKTIDKIGKRRR